MDGYDMCCFGDVYQQLLPLSRMKQQRYGWSEEGGGGCWVGAFTTSY